MQGSTWRFWVVTAATALTMAATASLGLWQLDRAAQKLALEAQINERGGLSAWDTPQLLGAADATAGVHRPVRLSGTWVPGRTVFLDNRQMNTRVGFFVVTPLRLEGSERVVLVQRGWVPRDFNDRNRVPDVPTPAGPVRLEGRLAPPPGKLYELGETGTGTIRQNIDLAAFAQETGLPLLGVSVLQTDAAADGLLREWPRVAIDVQKHHGYAFQWFALCALAGFLYLWFQILSPAESADPMAQTPDEPLTLTVHSLPQLDQASADAAASTRKGRWKMLGLMLVCAAPVIASYFMYYVVRPDGRQNYGELIDPQPALPAWTGTDAQGRAVPLASLKDQWLLVSVADSACNEACVEHLYLQRQLRETLGREKDRLDWVWLRTGDAALSEPLQKATAAAVVLQVDAQAVAGWLQPAPGQKIEDHLYVVDPLGHWMMRFPAKLDPKQAKRDLDRLLRASSSWDKEGRSAN